jgi:hypothetical protein
MCSCKKDALWEFHQALGRTNARPVELVTRGKYAILMKDILGRLEDFEYDAPKGSSDYCSLGFENKVILPAIKNVRTNFDGIYLDCINDPRRKNKEPEHGPDEKRVYDLGCRFKHGQPTWYFSWLYSLKVQEKQEKEQESEKMKELEGS